jgi:hypothetical protein
MSHRKHAPVDERLKILTRSSSARVRHLDLQSERIGAAATGASAVGAAALGTLAIGALAIGALAIGALAIGRLAIGRTRIRRVEIDDLVVRRLHITDELRVPDTFESND